MLTQQLLDRVRRAVPGRNWGVVDADDLYQAGVLAILEHIDANPDDDPSEDLLANIAWRRMRSHLRKELRRSGRCNGAGFVDVFCGDADDVDARLDAAEALNKLDATKRRWIEAQIREGEAIKDLAPEFGIAHPTGQLWNHKVYKALRPGLEDGYGEAANRKRSKKPEKRVDNRRNRYILARAVHPTPEF